MATNGRQRIDECWLLLHVPSCLARGQLRGGELVSQEYDDAEQAQEAGSRAVHCTGAPVALRLEPQVGTRFLEGDLDLPAAKVLSDDLLHRNAVVGAQQGERVAFARRVT